MASSASAASVRVLSAGAQLDAPRRDREADGELWLARDELRDATGWQLEPEGLCKDGSCTPLGGAAGGLVDGDLVCASNVWKALRRPVLHDAARTTWFLGEAADDRARRLASLEAPDFTLPDVEGKLHSLSDYRGRKVLLATWASW
jgi:hypothetical protein